MRACPACGGVTRRALAPGFFECQSMRSSDEEGESPQQLCGEKYLDTSETRLLRRSLAHFFYGY